LEEKMPNTVKVGAKLKKKDAPDYRLEVLELRTPEGDLPHARARIRISRFDLGVRLYSVSALQDPRLFIQENEPPTHIDMQ
jgi:hypothetical protein